jgi:hypothetical protein
MTVFDCCEWTLRGAWLRQRKSAGDFPNPQASSFSLNATRKKEGIKPSFFRVGLLEFLKELFNYRLLLNIFATFELPPSQNLPHDNLR